MKAKMKLTRLLSVLLCCAMLVGIFPTTAYAWDTTTYCDFCGEFIADDWICGGGDHCGPDSGHSDCFEENHCQDCGDCRDDGDWCETCHMHIQCAIDNDCHCSNCEACISGGGVVTCDSCGEYCSECGDDWCDECNLCVFCGVADNSHCEDCYACTAAEGCQLCYRCFDCGGVCSDECDDLCLECHWAEGGACEECDTCYIHDDTVYCPTCKLCHNCTGGYCESCGQCGSDVILCGGCGMYCSECVPICEECGAACTECNEELCPSCYTCNNCVVMCENCYNCVNCFDFCSFCGLCEECTTLCENCYEVCGDCAFMCNICLVCEECTDLCDNCHELCGDCAILCRGCLWCEDCADICPACGEVCSNCGTICEDCGLCEDCCEASTTTTISTVDVTVREPVAGAHPQDAVSNTDNVSVSNTVWSHNGEVMSSSDYFVAGETYRAQVTLETDSGYVFKDGVILTFNGYNIIMFCGNVVQLTYDEEFTAAAASTEYSITVTDGKATVGAGTEITKVAEGTTVTLTANAAPTDKVFDKWEVASGSITLADATSATTTFTMPAGAVSVKATYKDKPVTTYTVSFAANGGTGTMADVTGISGEYTLPANGFTAPDGKQFKAWSVGGVEKAAGDKITVTANTTATAVWENVPVVTYTVSGTATSFGSDTDNVIPQLIAEGYSEADYEVFVKGNTAEYSIEGVSAGTYTMKVMKNNHVTREYTVTVGAENVTQDVKIHLKGDTNGDGKVSVADARSMLVAIAGGNADNQYIAIADLNGDGKLSIADARSLLVKIANGEV